MTSPRRPGHLRVWNRAGHWALLTGAAILLAGCSPDQPLNPSFPLTWSDAKADLQRMRGEPKAIARPLVIASGLYDPGLVSAALTRRLRGLTRSDAPIESVSFFFNGSFESCRARLIDAVEEAFPGASGENDVLIDVIGVSMGGLVARAAASSTEEDPRRLRIARLFTISSPHRGARLSWMPTCDSRVIDMRAGSDFLADLDAHLAEARYEIIPYGRLGDAIVGVENTAPHGVHPWWVANAPLSFAHVGAPEDPRILADIARRVRDETPWTSVPAAAIPGSTPEASEPSDGIRR